MADQQATHNASGDMLAPIAIPSSAGRLAISNGSTHAESKPAMAINDIQPEYHSAAPAQPSLAELRQRAQIALNRNRPATMKPSADMDHVRLDSGSNDKQGEVTAAAATTSKAEAPAPSVQIPFSKTRLNFIWGAPAGAVAVIAGGENSNGSASAAAEAKPDLSAGGPGNVTRSLSRYHNDGTRIAQATSDAELLASAARTSLHQKRAAAVAAQKTTIVDAEKLRLARESVKREEVEEAERLRSVEVEQKREQDQLTGKDAIIKPKLEGKDEAAEKAGERDGELFLANDQAAEDHTDAAEPAGSEKQASSREQAAAAQDEQMTSANGEDAAVGSVKKPLNAADKAESDSSSDSSDDSSSSSSSSDDDSSEEEEDPASAAAYIRKKTAISKMLGENKEEEDDEDNDTDLDAEATVQAMVGGIGIDGGGDDDDEDDEDGGGKSGGRNGPMTKNEISYQELLTGGEAKSATVDGFKIATELPFVNVPAELKGSLRYLGTVQSVIRDEPSVLVVRQDLESGGGFVDSDGRPANGEGAVSGGAGAGSYRIYSRSNEQRGGSSGKPEAYAVLDTGSLLCTESGRVISNVFETFGTVSQPFYSALLPAKIKYPESAGGLQSQPLQPAQGDRIFFLTSHSSQVLTRSLKLLPKGSDASNVYDEEVGDEEREFSDDEEEAVFKKSRKDEKKRNGRAAAMPNAADGRQVKRPRPDDSRVNDTGGLAPPQNAADQRPMRRAPQPYEVTDDLVSNADNTRQELSPSAAYSASVLSRLCPPPSAPSQTQTNPSRTLERSQTPAQHQPQPQPQSRAHSQTPQPARREPSSVSHRGRGSPPSARPARASNGRDNLHNGRGERSSSYRDNHARRESCPARESRDRYDDRSYDYDRRQDSRPPPLHHEYSQPHSEQQPSAMNAMMQQPLPGFTPDAAMLSQMGGFNPYMAYQMSWQMNQLQQMQQQMAPNAGAFNPMFMPPQLAAAAAMAMQPPTSFGTAAPVQGSSDHYQPRDRGRGRGGFSRGRGRGH